MSPKVLIADDSQIIRSHLRQLFREDGWIVAGEAADGLEAVQKTRHLKPDLVILDISMPCADGFEALPQILSGSPAPKVIIFTLHEGQAFRRRAADAGAHGYITKSQPLEDLLAEANRLLRRKS